MIKENCYVILNVQSTAIRDALRFITGVNVFDITKVGVSRSLQSINNKDNF